VNAVERLEAAITKLETLRAESTPGRWVAEDESFNGPYVRAWFDNEFNGNTGIAGTRHGMPDADLIVTLHRTIDAQLAILRAARDDFERFGRKPSKFFENDVALADAILGGSDA
jgi:hypothetical protein